MRSVGFSRACTTPRSAAAAESPLPQKHRSDRLGHLYSTRAPNAAMNPNNIRAAPVSGVVVEVNPLRGPGRQIDLSPEPVLDQGSGGAGGRPAAARRGRTARQAPTSSVAADAPGRNSAPQVVIAGVGPPPFYVRTNACVCNGWRCDDL
jgi:hypothetical protein